MKYPRHLPSELNSASRRLGIPLSRFVLVVRIQSQSLDLFKRLAQEPSGSHLLVRRYRCSTSKFGIGQVAGSNCTPLGLHRISDKIGDGWPVGTVFKSRQMIGHTWQGMPNATITNRILWLDGLEPGLNRGGNVDSHSRYIYIHGTGDEPGLGRPASHGCIHLAADDLIPLFDKLPIGTLVWIGER